MVWLALFCVVAVIWIVVELVASGINKDGDKRSKNDVRLMRIWARVVGGILLAIFLVFGSLVSVPAGNVGVITRFGGVTGRTIEQGLNVKVPFFDNCVTMSIRTQKYEGSRLTAASKDLQDVFTSIAINYKLDPSRAAEVYRTIGTGYIEVIAHPLIQEEVKAITARYNAEDCILRRVDVKNDISVALSSGLAKRGIVTEAINITDFSFSPDFSKSIEDKVVATQRVQTAENDLKRIEVEARQAAQKAEGEAAAAIAAAKGKATAMQLVADAQAAANKTVAQSLSPEVLAYILYTNIGDNDKIVVVPNNGYNSSIVINPSTITTTVTGK